MLNTFVSEYGKFTLLAGEEFVSKPFKEGGHWEGDFIKHMLSIIPSDRNILEIGSHVGTHTIPYAKATSGILYAFEPQKTLYHLLRWNIRQNNVNNVKTHHAAVCHYCGKTHMSHYFPDGVAANHPIEYRETGNFGGITLGTTGESVDCVTLDSLSYNNIGFVHIDAQGAEPLIFYAAEKFIEKNRPIICFENNKGSYLEELMQREINVSSNILTYDAKAFCQIKGYSTEIIDDMVVLFP